MKWMVAPTYQNWTMKEVDEENKKALVVTTCDRCGGTGAYQIPGVFVGVCFQCNGNGRLSKWVKAYNEKEYERYVKTQKRAKERKAEKEAARIADLDNNSEANKAACLEKMGFKGDEIYLVSGNTFEIKDYIKERGGHFNQDLNWYFTEKVELPEGHELVAVKIDDVFDWLPRVKRLELKENAKEVAAAARRTVEPKSASEYVGEIKQRLRDLKVVLDGARAVSSAYGESIMFTFKCGENVFVWFTSCPPDADKAIIGHEYLLTGTVKDHKEYNGVKQTYLNRCILKEIAF